MVSVTLPDLCAHTNNAKRDGFEYIKNHDRFIKKGFRISKFGPS